MYGCAISHILKLMEKENMSDNYGYQQPSVARSGANVDAGLKAHMHRLLQAQRVQRSLAVLMITHDVAEAVTLADTVLVMAAQPARIVWRLDVAQPPDQRSDEWVLRQTAALLAQYPDMQAHYAAWAGTLPTSPAPTSTLTPPSDRA